MNGESIPQWQSKDQELPNYTRYIKISDTAKGLRFEVHAYGNDSTSAVDEAFKMYLDARQKAKDEKIPLAPVESK